MNFFSKIANLINGTPSNPSVQNHNESARNTAAHTELAESTSQFNYQGEHANASEYNNPEAEEKVCELTFDKSILASESLSEQRYGWHRYLVEILTSIKTNRRENLKHLTIYIRKGANKYRWNDEAFKTELRQALDQKGLGFLGTSSIAIELVSDKSFNQLSGKVIADFQYKKQIDEIIIFGSKKETIEQKFATAIDKRAFVINELLKKFRSSTGTDTKLMENLVIVVVRNEEDDDMAKYDWIGKRFEEDLKRELTNAFLEKIGSKSLQIILRPKSETEDCISLIDNQVYYKWGAADTSANYKPEEIPYKRVVATLSIIEGTGSMMKPSYILDSDKKKVYHIGRGITTRREGGKYRVNDIVINDKEADAELRRCNGDVSSAHADIIFKNNRYYIKAAIGGCGGNVGSRTVVRDEKPEELKDTARLRPLKDGVIIQLGKNVQLIYALSDEEPLTNIPDNPKSNSAMIIDDSF